MTVAAVPVVYVTRSQAHALDRAIARLRDSAGGNAAALVSFRLAEIELLERLRDRAIVLEHTIEGDSACR